MKKNIACLFVVVSCWALGNTASATTVTVPVSNSNFAILGTPPSVSPGWQNVAPHAPNNLWTVSNSGSSSSLLYQAQIGPSDHVAESLNAVLLGNAHNLSQDLSFNVSAGDKVNVSYLQIADALGPTLDASVSGQILVGATPYPFSTPAIISDTPYTVSILVANSGDLQLQFGSVNAWITNVGVTAQVVPEPSSLILCGLGALGLLVAARRRRKA